MIKVTLFNLTGSQKLDAELSLDSGIIKHNALDGHSGFEYRHITSLSSMGFKIIEKQEEPVKLKEVKKTKSKKV